MSPRGQTPRDIVVKVSESPAALTVTDRAGNVIMYAPATTGSTDDPLPIGSWAVTAVARNPPFNYNPGLFWDADPSHRKATIPPGPNGPVGLVWIDLSKPHYGIHGRPNPARWATPSRTAACGLRTGMRCAWPGWSARARRWNSSRDAVAAVSVWSDRGLIPEPGYVGEVDLVRQVHNRALCSGAPGGSGRPAQKSI